MSDIKIVSDILYTEILTEMPRDLINIIVSYLKFLPLKLIESITLEPKRFILDIMWGPGKTLVFHAKGIDTYIDGKFTSFCGLRINHINENKNIWFITEDITGKIFPVLPTGVVQKSCWDLIDGCCFRVLCGKLAIINYEKYIKFVKYENETFIVCEQVDVDSKIYEICQLSDIKYAVVLKDYVNIYSGTNNQPIQRIEHGYDAGWIVNVGLTANGNISYLRRIDYFIDAPLQYVCEAEKIANLVEIDLGSMRNKDLFTLCCDDGGIFQCKIPESIMIPDAVVCLTRSCLMLNASQLYDIQTQKLYKLPGNDDCKWYRPRKHGSYVVIGTRVYMDALILD